MKSLKESKKYKLKEIEKQLKNAFGWYSRQVLEHVYKSKDNNDTTVFFISDKYIKDLMNLISNQYDGICDNCDCEECKHDWDSKTANIPNPKLSPYWRCICPKCGKDISEYDVYYPPKTFK